MKANQRTIKLRTRAGWPILLGALSIPFVLDCGAAKELEQAASGCDEFQQGPEATARLDVDTEVKTFVSATSELKAVVSRIKVDVKSACVDICNRLGVADTWSAHGDDDASISNDEGTGACDKASAEIDTIMRESKARAKFALTVTSPKCSVDVDAQASCEASCKVDASCKPGEIDVVTRCDPAQLSVQCGGTCNFNAVCQGTASVAVQCHGECNSVCRGQCTGTCVGETGVMTENDADCRGKCKGTCKGSCEGDCRITEQAGIACGASASCKGGCTGHVHRAQVRNRAESTAPAVQRRRQLSSQLQQPRALQHALRTAAGHPHRGRERVAQDRSAQSCHRSQLPEAHPHGENARTARSSRGRRYEGQRHRRGAQQRHLERQSRRLRGGRSASSGIGERHDQRFRTSQRESGKQLLVQSKLKRIGRRDPAMQRVLGCTLGLAVGLVTLRAGAQGDGAKTVADPAGSTPRETAAPKNDAARDLDFFYLEAETGFQYTSLESLSVKRNVVPGIVRREDVGGILGAAAGVRLLFLTLGPRVRVGQFQDWDLWTLALELGWRVPIGALEPYMRIGGGYARLGRAFDAVRGNRGSVTIQGYTARLTAGADYFITPAFTFGASVAGEVVGMYRPGLDWNDEVYKLDGTSAGVAVTGTLGLGLHL